MKQLRFFFIFMLLMLGLSFLPKATAQESFVMNTLNNPNLLDTQSDYSDFKKKKKKKKKKSDSDYSLKDHLWYGGGVGLGFGSGFGYSQFGFSLSPMVGYKIFGPLSMGPRISIDYTSTKVQGVGTYNLFDVELSLFARVKIFKGLFAQGEIGTISDKYLYEDSNGLNTGTRTRPAQYVGLGYNFSNGEGGFGQEISIMYDFYIASDINAYETPWQYRFGITWGF